MAKEFDFHAWNESRERYPRETNNWLLSPPGLGTGREVLRRSGSADHFTFTPLSSLPNPTGPDGPELHSTFVSGGKRKHYQIDVGLGAVTQFEWMRTCADDEERSSALSASRNLPPFDFARSHQRDDDDESHRSTLLPFPVIEPDSLLTQARTLSEIQDNIWRSFRESSRDRESPRLDLPFKLIGGANDDTPAWSPTLPAFTARPNPCLEPTYGRQSTPLDDYWRDKSYSPPISTLGGTNPAYEDRLRNDFMRSQGMFDSGLAQFDICTGHDF